MNASKLSIIYLYMNCAYELRSIKITTQVIPLSRFQENRILRIEFLDCNVRTNIAPNSLCKFADSILTQSISNSGYRYSRYSGNEMIESIWNRIRDCSNSLGLSRYRKFSSWKVTRKKEAAVWYEFIKRCAFLFFRHKYPMFFIAGQADRRIAIGLLRKEFISKP